MTQSHEFIKHIFITEVQGISSGKILTRCFYSTGKKNHLCTITVEIFKTKPVTLTQRVKKKILGCDLHDQSIDQSIATNVTWLHFAFFFCDSFTAGSFHMSVNLSSTSTTCPEPVFWTRTLVFLSYKTIITLNSLALFVYLKIGRWAFDSHIYV